MVDIMRGRGVVLPSFQTNAEIGMIKGWKQFMIPPFVGRLKPEPKQGPLHSSAFGRINHFMAMLKGGFP